MDATYFLVLLWVLVIAGFAIWRATGHDMRPRNGTHRHGLALDDREHYLEVWKINQARYREDPRSAVLEAEELISSIMRRRGYRLSNLDRRPPNAPPAHERIVGNYSVAAEIVGRYRKGQTGADDLCKAMVCYRALFDQLLEIAAARR